MKAYKSFSCPNCGSKEVQAGIQNRGVTLIFARCLSCGFMRQSMARFS